jgi:aspartyl-tRNA(Asn)/glutamyl-tRNA(Gln) amidotransferase subunit B
MAFEPVIGLEIHAQLKTKSKLFCPASTHFGALPNVNVSPVSLGLPGALPVLNKEAVRLAIMAGLALECQIQERSIWARKNYFYPDLPKGYQISQFDHPICFGGRVRIESGLEIRITRIHMEEDAGKLTHQGADGIAGATGSMVDLNRAGVPLIEIVSEPDIRTAKDARFYMEKVHQILTFIGVCDGDLEKGSFRCDANISIRPVGTTDFGTRTEVKNLNSFRSLERAIYAEIDRQTMVLFSGGKVVQQTMNFDDATGKTTPLRNKEDAHDYRYFPDPDLKPLIIKQDLLDEIKSTMPDLPDVVKARYKSEYLLPEHDINVYLQNQKLYRFFEASKGYVKQAPLPVLSKWIVGELSAIVKDYSGPFQLSPEDFSELMDRCFIGELSANMVKEVMPKLLDGKTPLRDAIARLGGAQISDQDELQQVVDAVMLANPDVVEKIKNGKESSANFLMGQVMKQTKGRAKPDTVKALILSACQSE